MKSFSLSIIYFILTAICVAVMYSVSPDDLLGVFVLGLTTIYVFTKGMDHLNNHIGSR